MLIVFCIGPPRLNLSKHFYKSLLMASLCPQGGHLRVILSNLLSLSPISPLLGPSSLRSSSRAPLVHSLMMSPAGFFTSMCHSSGRGSHHPWPGVLALVAGLVSSSLCLLIHRSRAATVVFLKPRAAQDSPCLSLLDYSSLCLEKVRTA